MDNIQYESYSKRILTVTVRDDFTPPPSRFEMAVNCQDIYHGVLRCLNIKYDINHVLFEKFDSWSNVISGQFWFISGEISVEKFFLEKVYYTKRFVFEFQGDFWVIVLISVVISILDDFGSLLPARTVTVKLYQILFFTFFVWLQLVSIIKIMLRWNLIDNLILPRVYIFWKFIF